MSSTNRGDPLSLARLNAAQRAHRSLAERYALREATSEQAEVHLRECLEVSELIRSDLPAVVRAAQKLVTEAAELVAAITDRNRRV